MRGLGLQIRRAYPGDLVGAQSKRRSPWGALGQIVADPDCLGTLSTVGIVVRDIRRGIDGPPMRLLK